jgi:CRP/FNR family transcriptional regulator
MAWSLRYSRRRLAQSLQESWKHMDTQNSFSADLSLLNRLKSLSFLSAGALRELAGALHAADFRRHEVVLPEEALATGVHILLRGAAKITCLNRCGERVVLALLAPGPLPEFLSLPVNRWHFRCEAHSDCRVGSVDWDQFDVITKSAPRSALERFHENDLMQWYRFFEGGLGLLLGFDLRARLVSTLLQLCSNFGVIESRGTLLRISLSHKELAELVGASRPRVSEHLADLEREHLIIRQGRQLIVRVDKIENPASVALRSGTDSFAKASVHLPKESQLYGPRSLAAGASL